MPNGMSTASKAYLSTYGASVIRRVQLVRDLLNADLRQYLDITDAVIEFDTLKGDSTLRSIRWDKPGMTPTIQLGEDGLLMPGHPASIWTQWGKDPEDCHIIFEIMVPLPGGKLEVQRTYYGEIADKELRIVNGARALALVTVHAINSAMSTKITKGSGDEDVAIGTVW